MINNGSGRGFAAFGIRQAVAIAMLLASSVSMCAATLAAPSAHAKAADHKAETKTEKTTTEKTETAKTPEPVIENVIPVTAEQLIDKPHEYLNKNVKFDSVFHAFSTLALDYKPAMRSSKQYLSFLVLPKNSHVPLSELKLAMAMPKEKDPDNQLLQGLKEGDTLEITGHVFAAALDEPWVDVLKLKKIASAPDKEKAEEKKASETEPEKK